jgi:hypothetical protein
MGAPVTFGVQLGVHADAIFDAERKNRFRLRRIWNEHMPQLAWCLTNPSKASEQLDDPTLRKVQTYARLWGFGGVSVVNVFPWCATNPKELYQREETESLVVENLYMIQGEADECDQMICGWGRNGLIDSRSHRVRSWLQKYRRKVFALRLLNDGEPEHPLYLPSRLKPIPFDVARMAEINAALARVIATPETDSTVTKPEAG